MIANKLIFEDEIRVIAPSRSLKIISHDTKLIANRTLSNCGLKVSFGKNSNSCDEFMSSSIKERIEDIHDAFSNENIKGIFTAIGGFNANQLLKYINYSLIKENPKIFCGYSDITALCNAIYHKTGLITYYGPHYSTFGIKYKNDYTVEFFKNCLMKDVPFDVHPSKEWSDDDWYLNQEDRKFYCNNGYTVINEGNASGRLIGGNLSTFCLLSGTEFMPSFENSILFLEDDCMSNSEIFDRQLQSIINQPDFHKIKGLLIGRFQLKSAVSSDKLNKILSSKKELRNIPIIADLDFGHTSPMLTLPIGGLTNIKITKQAATIRVGREVSNFMN